MSEYARKLLFYKINEKTKWKLIGFGILLVLAAFEVADGRRGTDSFGFLISLWFFWPVFTMRESVDIKMLYILPKKDSFMGQAFYWYNVWTSLFAVILFSTVTVIIGIYRGNVISQGYFWIRLLACNVCIHMFLIYKDITLDFIPYKKRTLKYIKGVTIAFVIVAVFLEGDPQNIHPAAICVFLLVEVLLRIYRKMAADEMRLTDFDDDQRMIAERDENIV